nr:MAG TPA: virulence protein RhuM family [Caudoviricetes sp.]
MDDQNKGEIIMYQTEDGLTEIQTTLINDTVWLSANQMAELFQRDEKTIRKHINNVFDEGELSRENNTQKMRVVHVKQPVAFYNLDVIISVGYRVKSQRGTQFRIWANGVLKEYLKKGFALDDERLKNLGGGDYWKELLDRIRDIRSSEKVMYRQVLDLYATSVDYTPNSPETVQFFKIVQNKLHFAAHGHTAAEVVYQRADADKPFMGMTSFKGEHPTLQEVGIAKNYLTEEELKVLNNLVSGYFDFAEIQAIRHNPMYMKDYIEQLDNILASMGEKKLVGAGSITHRQALEKAREEYKKYRIKTLSPVEEDYLKTIRSLEKEAKKKAK